MDIFNTNTKTIIKIVEKWKSKYNVLPLKFNFKQTHPLRTKQRTKIHHTWRRTQKQQVMLETMYFFFHNNIL